MARPIVKYLDPVSGGYEFATVVDIGDLRNLNTTIKSDIVGAINSIISDGVHNPVNDERIENLETIIDSLKDGTFQIEDFGSIDEHLKQKFLEELDKINAQNREEMQSVLTKLDTSVDDAIRGYQEKVAAQNIILENAENTLVDARGTLEAKAAELETAKIGFSELRTEFDELDGYITTNIRTIDFDNFNAMVEDYETIVTQTSTEVGVDMSGSTLSYLTGRVTEAEANISAQADEITSKMSYDEFQYMPVPKYSYGENLLFDTFDFGDAWSGKNGAQVTPDTFLFGKVVAFNSPTGLYETRTDDLTIGESYVLSTYVNVQPSEKGPSQDKYEPISTSYDPTDFKVQIGGKSFNPGVYEDLSGINGWVRINQEFVADAVNPIISITPVGVNSQSEVAYMAMPKVEKGLTVTPWQPHVEDNYATISSTQSMIKQQANSITAFVTEVSELDDSYKQATSTFKMLADGFEANTEAVKNYEDAVIRYGTEYSNINGKFEQKVWKDDFKTAIEDINIDNRNRVLNSDFIRSEISSSDRRLIVEDWSLNSDWEIKTIDNDKYLSRNRTGLTQNLITSASSNYFPVRNGERILFGFDLIHSGLDDDKVFAIELFDISDKRLLKQEFSLSSLAKVGNRYHGSFSISTPGVEKGSVVLQLPKNGSVSFTKILFQNADIGSVDWSPAPEDSWIIQSKLETYISQVEDEITIGGTGQKLDTLTGLLTEDKGTFTLNPDKIASEVLNSKTYDDMGFVNKTNFEQTADGWIQEITSEGRLAGYINASPDTYRISFDKILLEGTTWADALGSSKIMVTENFALMGKNGKPVLDVKNDGSINMNITSLKIGEYNALTTNDKSDIESEVADKVINTTKPYIHIAYADTEDGQGLSFNPSGKQYIGFAKSHLPTPSGTASNYEWSKYVGADGYEGADGVGIKSTTVRYASSTSGTSQPSTGWSSTIPTVEPGNYLWTEIVWTYTNSEKKQSYTVARIGRDGEQGPRGLTGAQGPQGDQGIKGADGKDGKSSYTHIAYADTMTGTGFSHSDASKPFIGIYTDNNPTSSGTASKYTWSKWHGEDGSDGVQGPKGADGLPSYTHFAYANNATGTSGFSTTDSLNKSYLGIYTDNIKADSEDPAKYTWTLIKGATGAQGPRGVQGLQGPKGDQGIKGNTGADGKSSYTHIAYATGNQGQSFSHSTFEQATYVGMYVSNNQNSSDNWRDYEWTLIRGRDGSQGVRGPQGADGKTPYFHIAYANNSTGTSGFSINDSANKLYIGTYTDFEPDDSLDPTKYNWTLVKGAKGDKGDTGKDGVAGKDGVGIQKTEVHYASSTSGTNKPSTGWNLTVPTTSPGNYLWTRTTWTYTDGSKEEGYSVSRIGKDGNTGKDGIAGKDGVGIKSTVINYATSSSGTTKPTSGWTSTIPSVAPGNYLWTRTVWTYTDNDVETGYSVSRIGEKGDKGDTGAAGTGIKSSEISYVIHTNGTTAPTLGWVSTVPSPVKGRYLWTRTITTYTDNTTSTTYSVAYQATDGQRGDTGATGTGVSSTTVTYAQTTSGTTTPTSWSSTRPAPIKGQYLWSRTIITYTNGSSSTAYNTSYSATDGQKGDKGDKGDTGPQGPRGIQGPSGSNGQSQWVHIRYSANSNGASMTTSPSSTTKYVGIAVTNSATAPGYTGFTWSKYVGENGSRGPQGLPGKKGDDGTTTYTWIRYADTPTSGMNQYPDGKKYIGMAFNKTTQTESNNYSDYQWSLMPQNIEIGGRNYFSLTRLNTLSPSSWVVRAYVYNFTLEPNTKYILSSNVPTGGDASETVLYFNGSGTASNGAWLNNPRIMETDNEGKFYIAIPTGRTYTNAILNGDYWVQLEKGNTATDWSPAPEDIEAAYTSVAQAKAEAERIKAESYADGIVSDEEKARIKDADAKLAAAKKYAVDQILADKTIQDTRNDNETPAWYYTNHPRRTVKEFKLTSTIGVVSSEGTYGILETEIPWKDASGGPVKQTFRVNSKTFKRSGTTTSWSSWVSYDDIAETAKSIADSAKASASTANSLLTDIASDSKLTATEKKAAKKEWDIIVGEKPKIDSSANTYGIITEKTAYNTAYNTLNNYLSSLLANLNTTSNIVGATFRANFKAYYNARQDLLNKIADGAKSLVDEIEVGGRNLVLNTKGKLYRTFGTGATLSEVDGATRLTWTSAAQTSMGENLSVPLVVGESYTLTFEARGTLSSPHLELYILTTSGANLNLSSSLSERVVTNEFKKYTATFKFTGNPSDRLFIGGRGPSGTWLEVKDATVKLEKGNKATDWSPAPEDVYQYVDNIEVGSTNLLKDSRTIFLSSNNNATYPASITDMEENGRSFSRVRRTNLNLSPSIFSIYSAMSIEDINKSIFDNESTVVSFKARASQNVTMKTMNSTYGGSPLVTGSLGDINVTTEWKTFYSIFPKIPKSASGFRVNPLNNITDVNMSTFYIDLCEWKIEKGNKPTDWSPAPEDVQAEINDKASAEDLTNVSNDLNTSIGDLSNTVDGKVDKSLYEEFLEHNANIQEQLSTSTANAQEDITKALARTATVEQKLGEGAADWIFTHTQIRMSDEGITLGEQGSGSYLQITNDQISFYNGSEDPVAFINGGMLNINHAIFVESIQISEFMFSSEISGHLTLRYVGN